MKFTTLVCALSLMIAGSVSIATAQTNDAGSAPSNSMGNDMPSSASEASSAPVSKKHGKHGKKYKKSAKKSTHKKKHKKHKKHPVS